MPIVTLGLSKLFSDWPDRYEDAPDETKALLRAVHNFTESVGKGELQAAVSQLPILHSRLHHRQALLAGDGAPSYRTWLVAYYITPLQGSIEEFNRHYDRRRQTSSPHKPIPLEYAMNYWVVLYAKVLQLQYVLEGREAPFLVDEDEESAV